MQEAESCKSRGCNAQSSRSLPHLYEVFPVGTHVYAESLRGGGVMSMTDRTIMITAKIMKMMATAFSRG